MILCLGVSMSLWVWYVSRNRLVVVINFIALCLELVGVFVKGFFRCNSHLFFLFQWNFYVIGIFDQGVVDWEVRCIWAFSDKIRPSFDSILSRNFEITIAYPVPHLARVVTWYRGPRPWCGFPRTVKHCYFPCFGYYGPRRWWPRNMEGRGRTRTGTRDVQESNRKAGSSGVSAHGTTTKIIFC